MSSQSADRNISPSQAQETPDAPTDRAVKVAVQNKDTGGKSAHDQKKSNFSAKQGKSAKDKHAGSAMQTTPMMAQYIEIKAANPDCLLFYRMGDFYELFFEDASLASRALGIQLTTRGKHLGDDIPMCGVPVHAAEEYLQRLIERGFRVAVCETNGRPRPGTQAWRQSGGAPRRGTACDARNHH